VTIERVRILHGEYFNYWFSNNEFACVNFNLLSSSENLRHRTLDFYSRNPVSPPSGKLIPVDVVYSTKYGPLAIHIVTDSSDAYIELYPEYVMNKEVTPVGKMKVDRNLSDTTNLEFLRLDNHIFSEENVIADLIFYRKNTPLLYYVLDMDGKSHQTNTMRMPDEGKIQNVRVLNSRFLMIETITNILQNSSNSSSSSSTLQVNKTKATIIYLLDLESTRQKVNNAIEDYCMCSKSNATEADRNDSSKWSACAFSIKDSEYVNSYNLPENPGNFFFEFKTKVDDLNAALNTSSKGRIDVFLCQRGAFTECEPIIKDWAELTHRTATRFTGDGYFLQIWSNVTKNFTKLTDSRNATLYNILIHFSMSPKRYKAVPRYINTHNISMGEMEVDSKLSYYFDEVSELIYVTGKNFSNAYKIDPVKLRIQFVDFNSSCTDDKTDEGKIKKPTILPQSHYIRWINLDLQFNGISSTRTVSHNLAYDNKTNIGEYFFMPRYSDNIRPYPENNPTIHYIDQSLPMGITKSVDLSDLFRGSFMKLKSDKANNTLQEISNTYLDPVSVQTKNEET
jgi:hypothetical protein